MPIGCCQEDECETIAVGIPGPPGHSGPAAHVEITGLAAQNLSGHRAVYRRADGLIDYADATDLSHISRAIGITTGAVMAGAAVKVVMLGEMNEVSWTWTVPGLIFLGTNGLLTQTVPVFPSADFQAGLGYAVSPTRMYVDRQPSIHLT